MMCVHTMFVPMMGCRFLQKREVESVPSASAEKESVQASHKESVDEDRIPIYAEQDEFRDENDHESDGSGSSREDARNLLTRSRKLTSKVVKVARSGYVFVYVWVVMYVCT